MQLAMESRSQHRSQDMGAGQPLGPQNAGVLLVDARVADAGESLFSGIDTTLIGLTETLPEPTARGAVRLLSTYRDAVARATRAFSLDLTASADALADAGAALSDALAAIEGSGSPELERVLTRRHDLVDRALMAAAGIVFDVRASDDIVVPGQVVEVEAMLWNGGEQALLAPEVSLEPRMGWPVTRVDVSGVSADGRIPPGTLATWRFRVGVPEDAELSRLYYLRAPRDGAMYRWPAEPELHGLPRDPAAVTGMVSFSVDAPRGPVPVRRSTPWRYVGVDQGFGEFVEPILVLPSVSVRVSPSHMVWPEGLAGTRNVSVSVRSEDERGSRGQVRLEVPDGWRVTPERGSFELPAAGSEGTVSFEVFPEGPATASGAGAVRVVAHATTDDGRVYDEGFALIDYPHIERAALFSPAVTEIGVVPVRVRDGLRVGYVMGTGDDGPEAIRQMGASVELVSEARVRAGDFAGYDVLVLGVRAYEARADVRAANQQILDFARAGGVVVNQYNQYQFSDGGYAPEQLVIGRPAPRVSVETRPVRILEPDAPIFTFPNRIDDGDFDGWVQERGLYFASEWSDAWTPMLEMNDPDEPARRGSLLVAPVGEGVYVYAALSFFRQWSGQVPGAYRLFANLISLDPAAWRAFEGR
jgi:hypothetical protein